MLLACARASVVVLLGLATQTSAGTTSLDVLVDADSNQSTGCSVVTPEGTLSGVELRLTIPVGTTAATGAVGALTAQICSGGSFGAASPVDGGGWPIGVGLGTFGSDVIEAYLPISLLGSSQFVRLAVVSAAEVIGPATVALDGGSSINIPTLSPLAMAFLAIGLAALALRYLRPGSGLGVVLLVLPVLLAGGGIAWAVIAAHDGNPADWTGVSPLGTKQIGDAPAGVDLVALFARPDGANLEIRVDARLAFDAANLAPVVNAGADQSVALPASATLNGAATDDGLPAQPGALTVTWTQVSGPATAAFGNPNIASTTASFPAPGLYTLRLTAFDGSLSTGDNVKVNATGLVTVLDRAAAVQAVVGAGGATLRVVSGGKTYTLTIPIAALPADTTITMTPVTGIPNLPVFSGGLVAAVDLKPAGLQFARPASLAVTLPSAISPAALLGFLIDESGTNLEVHDVAVNGSVLTLAVPHFTVVGITQAQLTDFANDIRPILDSLTIPVSPTAAQNLITRLGSWIRRFPTVCTGTDLCTRAFSIAAQSLAQNQAQACAQARTFIQQGEPFLARTALGSVVKLAAELAQISSNAETLGLPGFEITFDLTCVGDGLGAIATLARDQAIANPRAGLLLLLKDIRGDAELLALGTVSASVDTALLAALDAILVEANQDCLTDPVTGELLIDLVLNTFGDNFLDGLSPGLDTRYRDARAGCRVRISPPSANVELGQQVQFTGTVIGVAPPAVTWSLQSPTLGNTIDPTTGLFTAGEFSGTVVVVATSVANPTLFRRATVRVAINVQVSVSPGSVTVLPLSTRQFSATVTGTLNTGVIWTVNGGGTISQTGLFTAGGAVGIFTVRATSVVNPGVFGEAVAVISGGRIDAITNPAYIGVCGSANIRVFTSGFVDPSMTFSIQGAGSLRSQTLIGADTFSTWAASSTATGQIVVTARSVENPNLTAIATLQVDPFVGGYGNFFEGATVVRGADAALPDDSYRVTVVSAFSGINESFVATGGPGGLSGTNPGNGNSITVVVGPHPQFGSRYMIGTVRLGGQDKPIEFPHSGSCVN